ncbi:MAG: S8 family serine peptidase [Gammaproteobacteria bacterium]|nr:S8 family serine peptidase [Gammaproteobacteria bacterium]
MATRSNRLFILSSLSFGLLSALSAQAAQVVEAQDARLDGKTYRFEKQMDAAGNIRETITRDGKPVKVLPVQPRQIAKPSLLAALKNAGDEQMLDLVVALRAPLLASQAKPESGEFVIREFLAESHRVDGKELSEAEAKSALAAADAQARQLRAQRQAAAGKLVNGVAKRLGLSARPEWQEAARQGAMSVQTRLPAGEIKALLAKHDKDVAGLELSFPVHDDVTSAMVDTNITDWALPFAGTKGSGVGIYMTESGCADEAGRTNYDRLAGSETAHSQNVFGILRAVSPSSYIYCRGGAVLPQLSDLDGVNGNPAIRIMSRSNGGNDSTTYSTLDRDWDQFAYDHNIAIFNAAGNEGNGTGNTISPAKGHGVFAVGNYMDSNDTINSSSSFVNPATKNAKPELSAPGTNITAGGYTMTGTSMATPHASAFLADMMSGFPAFTSRPHMAYAAMLAGATDAIAGGVDKVGAGGIDFLSAYYNGWFWYWQGSNGAFSGFDSGDGAADGYITKTHTLNAGTPVRVAIAWLNRGTYTYDHMADAHPIGQDLDLTVLAPNGSVVASSASYDNAYEVVNFTPSVSGQYKIRVKRFANRDTAGDFRLGMAVNLH